MRLLQKTLPGFDVNRFASDAFVSYTQRSSVMIRNRPDNVNLFIVPEAMIENTIAKLVMRQEIFQ